MLDNARGRLLSWKSPQRTGFNPNRCQVPRLQYRQCLRGARRGPNCKRLHLRIGKAGPKSISPEGQEGGRGADPLDKGRNGQAVTSSGNDTFARLKSRDGERRLPAKREAGGDIRGLKQSASPCEKGRRNWTP